ncbi:MAG: tRNA 2-selenouridine(34) synthase MnmH [Bacteroidia bacterium]|nr:tRNA 2-selenouridine(34) synthase MnmH [Bacteroidia bacterium]
MQLRTLPIDEFLGQVQRNDAVVFDTRSEKEFEKAHLPGAISLPLLNNEHRHLIGTVYKQEGREAAVLKGFELVGPLFHTLIMKAIEHAEGRAVFLYCWRGGMRSNIMAWLLRMAGLKVTLLEGGYKSYRHWVLRQFDKPFRFLILGGKTGSGKTELLKMIRFSGEQVIDLEQLASHKGSAFGLLGMPPQPSQEQFENLLAMELYKMKEAEWIWLENESRGIGRVVIPNPVFDRMRAAPVLEVDVDRAERFQRILKEYCVFPKELLAENTCRIERRLGGQHLKAALRFLEEDNLDGWLDIVLNYYDKTYAFSNEQREEARISILPFTWNDPEAGLRKLITKGHETAVNSNNK